MPHFEAHKITILTKESIPKEFAKYSLEEIYKDMNNKQYPITVQIGKTSHEIGMLIGSYLGRDAIVADIGLDPEFKLILETETITDEETKEKKEIITVKGLEWT